MRAPSESPRPRASRGSSRALLLIGAAVALNLGLGQLVLVRLQWPLYLDSLGTVLVGALLGPLAGAATGAASNLLWAAITGDVARAPYAITAAFIGLAAGYGAGLGVFRSAGRAALAGLLVGLGAALVSAPITAYLFGGVTGTGGDYLIGLLGATGANLLQAATIQGLLSDPVDKTITFLAAFALLPRLRPLLPERSATEIGRLSAAAPDGYAAALAASLLALLLSFVFLPAFGTAVFSVFYLAVLVSAWRGGLGPALLTTAIGATASLLLLVSPYQEAGLSAQDLLWTAVFLAVSLAIARIGERLEQSRREMAEALAAERELERMKSAFVSQVSHELRTPLTSIQGYTELLLEGDGGVIDDEAASMLRVVDANARRLVAMVSDLLDLARIEAGRMELRIEDVDLEAALRDVATTLRPSLEARAQRLTLPAEPAVGWLRADPDALRRILINYLSNASKYGPEGGEIRVTVGRDGARTRVAVSDDGPGISEEDQARLFTRFFRADGPTTRGVTGTGLGLSIVRELVALQGGEVGVRSAPGQGATFSFILPTADAPSAPAPSDARETPGGRT